MQTLKLILNYLHQHISYNDHDQTSFHVYGILHQKVLRFELSREAIKLHPEYIYIHWLLHDIHSMPVIYPVDCDTFNKIKEGKRLTLLYVICTSFIPLFIVNILSSVGHGLVHRQVQEQVVLLLFTGANSYKNCDVHLYVCNYLFTDHKMTVYFLLVYSGVLYFNWAVNIDLLESSLLLLANKSNVHCLGKYDDDGIDKR